MRKQIIEKFIDANTGKEHISLKYTGKLNFDLSKDKEWASISVDKPTWRARADRHLIVPDLWSAPSYSPHVSAFSKEEVQNMTKETIEGLDGKEITFNFTDTLRIVDPDGWDEVYEVAFEPVNCLYLEHLRMKLNLTPKMKINHEFHMTLGIKLVKDREKHKKKNI